MEYFEKRYTHIAFPEGQWSKQRAADGTRTYTATAVSNVTIQRADGGSQVHQDCPVGTKIICKDGDAEVEVP